MFDKAILMGGGGFGRELLSWAEAAHRSGQGPEVIGYADDAGPTMDGFRGISLPYLGPISNLQHDDAALLLAIGTPATKKALAERLRAAGAQWASVVHPSAIVTDNALLGEGVVIGPQCYVANHVEIGDLVAINSFCGIGHDVRLEDFSTLSSGIDLMGGVIVESEAFIGSGARVLPGVRIGKGARIGAGAIVVRQVKPGQTVYASPAKTL